MPLSITYEVIKIYIFNYVSANFQTETHGYKSKSNSPMSTWNPMVPHLLRDKETVGWYPFVIISFS